MIVGRVGIILQARFGSTRLPGKVLAPLGGRTILEHCLHRLMSSGVGQVILATTDAVEDDALAALAERMGTSLFRGDRDDVLDRFVRAAAAFELDTVIRATADNPGLDWDAPGRLLAAMAECDVDYMCESGLPYGAAVELVAAAALRRAHVVFKAPYEREHVTPGIRAGRAMFHASVRPAPVSLTCPSLRVTVDTREDLEWMRGLFARTGTTNPSLADLIAAAHVIGREAA